MNNWSEGEIDSDGLAVHYYRSASPERQSRHKPALILVHGFTDNGLCWSRTAQILQARFDVVMVDARNHGQSASGSAHINELTADLAQVIQQLKIHPALVMGHSVGASVTAALAAQYPELVRAIILEDPPWTENQHPTSAKRARAFSQHIKAQQQLPVEEIAAQGKLAYPNWHNDEFSAWAQSNLQVRADALAQLDLADWRQSIGAIQCPALLLYCDAKLDAMGVGDGIVSHLLAKQIEGLNSNFSCTHIGGGGHNLRREQFSAFMMQVQTFLKRV